MIFWDWLNPELLSFVGYLGSRTVEATRLHEAACAVFVDG